MTRLANELVLDQLQFRRINALVSGDRLSTTGQRIEGSLPTRECIDARAGIPCRRPRSTTTRARGRVAPA